MAGPFRCSMSTLYIVATPIGNLQDLSPRAKQTLAEVKVVFCEDTRVAKKLFSALHIPTPRLVTVQAHTTESALRSALTTLESVDAAALITDAGTPGIADPGAWFLDRAYEHISDLHVVPIPGPVAAMAALSVSGFYGDRFLFLGFPPHQKGRVAFFAEVAAATDTVVLYESVHRIEKTLTALVEAVGKERLVCVCREITKLHETTVRGPLGQVMDAVLSAPRKGEYVIVVNRPR